MIRIRALALLCFLGLVGCEHDNSDLDTYIDAVKAKPASDIAAIPEVTAYQPFNYPDHQRSPFDDGVLAAKLVTEHKPVGSIKVDQHRSKEYLESFPLDALKMVGTMQQGGQEWALIRTPEGTIQRVRVGNYMGQNHGKITTVTDNSVKLSEVTPDGYGGFIKRPASIAIKTP
ncbi:MAG TPA: pilus assembly protein PilP [Gammaproteobacteria bacterium]|nr:pilus assembly protein PilP [Gammaproteobacteria bacterium]